MNSNDANRRQFLKSSTLFMAASSLARPADAVETTPTPPVPAATLDMRIQRLSFAGVKIERGETTVLIDAFQDPALLEAPITEFVPIQVTTKRCYVLITHVHNDHYDPRVAKAHLTAERGKGVLICHRSLASTVAADGIHVQGVDHHECVVVSGGELAVTAVEAVDGLGANQVSWIVSGGGRS